jgi:hypothetical protein
LHFPRSVLAFSGLWLVVGGLCAFSAYFQGRFLLFGATGNAGGGGFILGASELFGLFPLALLHALFGLVLLIPRPIVRSMGIMFSAAGIAGTILLVVFGGVFVLILGAVALVELGERGKWLQILGMVSLPILYPATIYILKFTSIRLYYGPLP